MTLCIDGGIEPLLRCLDRFIDAVEGCVRIRGERWLVAFRHGVYS
ncbi:hypothetical protein CIW53_13640 [Rhodanobacter sp. T12-5]|nr:hypothetical protein CIW53_13640 [Rhodanobacter sp. T12-5]